MAHDGRPGRERAVEGRPSYLANRLNETLRIVTMIPPRDWNAIVWPEVSASDAARWIAVLPLAATEQHGPHLPLRTDVRVAEAYLARVRELLPASIPATFLP